MVFLWLFYSTTSEHGVDVGGTPRHAPSIQRIRALFGEKGEESPACHPESLREGWLHCKVTAVEGKVKRYSIHATTSDPFFVSLNTFSASCQHSNILDYNCSLYFSISHVSLKKSVVGKKVGKFGQSLRYSPTRIFLLLPIFFYIFHRLIWWSKNVYIFLEIRRSFLEKCLRGAH